MSAETNHTGINWENINLKDNYEKNQNIIDPLNFDTLLLEINCNLPKINAATVRAQFETDLKCRIESAREIFENNLQNIIATANEYRNQD